jgi:hypothetical protein
MGGGLPDLNPKTRKIEAKKVRLDALRVIA